MGTVWIRFILLFLPKCTKNDTFFINSRMSKFVLAGFKLLLMSRKFLEQDRIGLERFEYVLSCIYDWNVLKWGYFSSNLLGVHADLARFKLLSMSWNILENVTIARERFEYVWTCFYYQNVRKMGHFSSNLVKIIQFLRDLNYFQWAGSF